MADGVYFSDGIKALRRTGNQKRDGVMATLQYRPSNAWTSTLDAFHTKAEQIDTANQFELNLSNYNGGYTPGLNISNVRVNDSNSFTGGDASGVYPLVRGMYNKREDTIDAFGWNNEITAGAVKITADLNYSKATRDELNTENNLQRAPMPQLDTVGVSVVGNGFSQLAPGMDYSNPDQLFLTNTIYGSGYGKVPSVEDVLKGARLQASFPMPEALSWFSDYGCRRQLRQSRKTENPAGRQHHPWRAGRVHHRIGPAIRAGQPGLCRHRYPARLERPGGGLALHAVQSQRRCLVHGVKAWTVEEKITTAWLRANLDTEWGDVGVRGNIGVQLQSADQSSRANYWDASQPAGSEVRPIDDGKTYRDWLPSLNLAFQFPYEQTLRFAMAKQVARPRVDQLRASLEFGVDTSTGRPGASGGNPMLDPWRANAIDLSYEKYFAERAYVAAAFFYKDLKSYIYTQSRDNYDFSALVAGYVPPPGSAPVLTTGTFSAPFNGKGGTLRGVELTASLPLDLVFAPLEGFGIQASATFNDSDVKIRDPESASSVGDGEISLPGLSERVYNLTAYYEHKGFEARVSQRRRSDFIGEIGNFNGNRTLRYVVGENITDAQISYSFNDSSDLAGLTLLLQASNLSNSPYRTYAETKDRPLEYIEWGRTFVLGVNYKF